MLRGSALTIAFLVSCWSAGVESSSIIDVCKAAGPKKVTVCSALGFCGADGNAIYETLFSKGFGKEVIIARDEFDLEVGGSDVAVSMIKAVELNGDLNGLMITMQNIIEQALHRGRPSKLIVIVTGRIENDRDIRKINRIAEEMWALLPISKKGKTLADCLKLSVFGLIAKDESAVSNVASAVRVAVEESEQEAGARSGLQVAALAARKIATSQMLTGSTAEHKAVSECAAIAEDFLQNLRTRLTGGSALTLSVLPASVVASAVSEALTENYLKFQKEFDRHAYSDALRAASYRANAGLSAILQPIYRKSVALQRASSLRAFETLILRVAPNSRLVVALKSQAAAVMDNFKLRTSELKRDYDVMSRGIIKLDFPSVEMQGDESDQSTGRDAQEEEELLYTGSEAEEGIEEEKVVEAKEEVTGEMDETLSEETDKEADRVEEAKQVIPEVAKTVKAVSQRIKVVSTSVSVSSTPQRNILNGPWVSAVKSADVWGIGMELRNLRDGLAESCAERERFLFLSGAYNPYIRDMPIPPTKLSFNYLLDPAGLSYGREYNTMYDEQVDGLAERRANPLQVPGMADIPFDPNDHPVPRDATPWWRVIVDFYKGDSDE